MFKSKLFWGGVSLCSVVILFSILIYNANQPQETITIYKTLITHGTATDASHLQRNVSITSFNRR